MFYVYGSKCSIFEYSAVNSPNKNSCSFNKSEVNETENCSYVNEINDCDCFDSLEKFGKTKRSRNLILTKNRNLIILIKISN